MIRSLIDGIDVSIAVSKIAIVGCATVLFRSDAALADTGTSSIKAARADSIFLFIDIILLNQ
jgi:hypothetical protein